MASPLLQGIAERLPSPVFSDTELAALIPGSPARRHGIVKRAIAEDALIHLRRGLYTWPGAVDLYAITPQLYFPSYISLETALSFHGWIPEGVTSVTSVCARRAQRFETPVGTFVYSRIPDFQLVGVQRHGESAAFLMASPTRAVVDYVQVYKRAWIGTAPLRESLRIEPEHLRALCVTTLQALRDLRLRRDTLRFIDSLLAEIQA